MSEGQHGKHFLMQYLNKGRGWTKQMANISKADIQNAINAVTGAPSAGVVADVTPAIVKAIDELINGKPVVAEQRVVKPAETRKESTPSA
jgi:hypothetical protein